MRSVRFPTLTIASVLTAAALWSCNRMETGECWMLQGQGTAPEDGDE
jgi:hypothetical protein